MNIEAIEMFFEYLQKENKRKYAHCTLNNFYNFMHGQTSSLLKGLNGKEEVIYYLWDIERFINRQPVVD